MRADFVFTNIFDFAQDRMQLKDKTHFLSAPFTIPALLSKFAESQQHTLMLALEIRKNNDEPLIVAAEGLAFIDLTYGVSAHVSNQILVHGADDPASYTWLDEKAQNGDKIFVRIVNVDKDKISLPSKIKRKDIERIRQEFERLKQELQQKQLL